MRRGRDRAREEKNRPVEYLETDQRNATRLFSQHGGHLRQAIQLANRGMTDPTLQTAQAKNERAQQLIRNKGRRGKKRGFTVVPSQRADGSYIARGGTYTLIPINTRPLIPHPGTQNQYRVTGYGTSLAPTPLPIVGVRGTIRQRARGIPNYTVVTDALYQAYFLALRSLGGNNVPMDTLRHMVQVSYELPQYGNRMTYSRLVPVVEAVQEIIAMFTRDAGYNPGTTVSQLVQNRNFQFQFHLNPVVGQWQNPFAFDRELYRRRLFFIPPDLTEENNLCLFISVNLATRRKNIVEGNQIRTSKITPRKPNLQRDLDRENTLLEAVTLRAECGVGDQLCGAYELQRIADQTNLIIHVLQREACDSEIFRILPTEAKNNEEVKHECFHVYIYFVETHCHPITAPHLFLKNEGSDPRMSKAKKEPHLMCDWCYRTFKDKNLLLTHHQTCNKTEMNKRKDLAELKRSLGQRLKCNDYIYQNPPSYTKNIRYCEQCKVYFKYPSSEADPCFARKHWLKWVPNVLCTQCGEKDIPECYFHEHQCYCGVKLKENRDVTTLYFWDVESMFPEPLETIEPYKTVVDKEDRTWEMKKQQHIVNCVILMNHDGQQVWEFDTIDDFCSFVFDPANDEQFNNATFIAHNGGGYDNHFVNQFLLSNGKKPYLLPTNGSSPTRLITLKFLGRSFIDSLNFIAQPLSTFGKAFNLEVSKGYFPYEFNTFENQGYVGPIPPKEFYGIENSKCESVKHFEKIKRDFDEWYDEEAAKEEEWNLKEKLFMYCRLDVDVLRQGCLKFRDMCLSLAQTGEQNENWQLNSIDPFNYLTLSGVVINIALSGFKPKTFAQFPRKPQEKQQSWVMAYKDYLESQGYVFVNQDENIRNHFTKSYAFFEAIRPEDVHSMEQDIQPITWIHANCYNCGCPGCYPENRAIHVNPFMDETLENLFTLFQLNVTKLKGSGEVLVTFDHDLHKEDELAIRSPILRHVPIDPREALFGGRTEPFKLFATGPIFHIDVVSLYPTVCAFDEIPIGTPIHMHDPGEIWDLFVNRKELFGYVRCSIEPPDTLLIPFLPNRREEDGRLVFGLEPMTGTWTTVDLYFALQQGYRVTEVFQATHFPETEREIGPFRDYVDTFIKIKKKAKIDGNKTMYLIAKLFLNSLWGKFVEQPHKSNLSIVVNTAEYYELMDSPHIDTESMRWIEVKDNVWMVRYDFEDKFTKNAKNNNPYIGTFVLAHARRRLHEMMVQIGLDRVIYCDTDSIAYTHDIENEDNNPETGHDLGEWENEAEGHEQGNYITEFIGMGPKSYCEVFKKPELQGMDYLLKFKGVRTIEKTFSYLNPQSLKSLVLDYCVDPDADNSIGVDSWTINNQYMGLSRRDLGHRGMDHIDGADFRGEWGDGHFDGLDGFDGFDGGDGEDGIDRGDREEQKRDVIVNTFTMKNMKNCSVNLTKRMIPTTLLEQDRELVREIQTFPLGFNFSNMTEEEKYQKTFLT